MSSEDQLHILTGTNNLYALNVLVSSSNYLAIFVEATMLPF